MMMDPLESDPKLSKNLSLRPWIFSATLKKTGKNPKKFP
jgi:hypothetical protein